MNPQNNANFVAPAGVPNRSSQIVNTIIPAGGRFPVFQAGKQFYLIIATAPIFIKPIGGSSNKYSQGQGQEVAFEAGFASVELENKNAFSVVISLFVGFGGFIDNTFVPSNPGVKYITYSTSGTPNVSANILIPDLSGNTIVDMNGNPWLAIARQSLVVSNLDIASYYSLQNTLGTAQILGIPPRTDILYESDGNFSIKAGGNINAIVSEVYTAIQPTLLNS